MLSSGDVIPNQQFLIKLFSRSQSGKLDLDVTFGDVAIVPVRN